MSLESQFTDSDHRTRVSGASCPVLLVASATGGAGATTAVLTAAELASAAARISKVLAVDFDEGKSDMRLFLRLESRAPSLLSYAAQKKAAAAIVPENLVNGYRPEKIPDISFGVAPGADYTSTDESILSTDEKVSFISTMRKHSNLILVDCGRLETTTTKDSRLDFIARMMREGAYLLIMCEPTLPSVRRVEHATSLLESQFRIGKDRIMSLVNKRPPYFTLDGNWPSVKAQLALLSVPLTPVSLDVEGIMHPGAMGKLATGQVELTSSLASAMLRVSGLPEFEPLAAANSAEARASKATVRTASASVVAQTAGSTKRSRLGLRR